MNKTALILLAGLLAGTLSAETNWKAWVRPAGTVGEGDTAKFSAPAGKRTSFETKILLEKGHFYKVSFDLDFPGDAPEMFKCGFFSPELPFAFNEFKTGKGKISPVTYLYAKQDLDLWFRCYFVAGTDLKGIFSNPEFKKLSSDDLKKITLSEKTENVSDWFQPSWMKNALKLESVDAVDHIDEGKALKISVPAGFQGRTADLRSNPIPLLPETDYKITAWVKGGGMGTGTIGVDAWIRNGIKHYYANGSVAVSKEWKKVEFKFRTPSAAEQPALEYRSARAKFGFRPNAELTKVQLKDFTLEQVK